MGVQFLRSIIYSALFQFILFFAELLAVICLIFVTVIRPVEKAEKRKATNFSIGEVKKHYPNGP